DRPGSITERRRFVLPGRVHEKNRILSILWKRSAVPAYIGKLFCPSCKPRFIFSSTNFCRSFEDFSFATRYDFLLFVLRKAGHIGGSADRNRAALYRLD